MPIRKLVKAPVVVVRFPMEWYRLVSILFHVTLLVAPVSWDVMASFLLVDFPISRVETELTTIGQRLSSLVSLFVEPHIIGRAALLLTATPNQKSRLRMWR